MTALTKIVFLLLLCTVLFGVPWFFRLARLVRRYLSCSSPVYFLVLAFPWSNIFSLTFCVGFQVTSFQCWTGWFVFRCFYLSLRTTHILYRFETIPFVSLGDSQKLLIWANHLWRCESQTRLQDDPKPSSSTGSFATFLPKFCSGFYFSYLSSQHFRSARIECIHVWILSNGFYCHWNYARINGWHISPSDYVQNLIS